MSLTENIESFSKVLNDLTKVVEKVYEQWFKELICFSVMAIIVFATQASIIPTSLLKTDFNVFIALLIIGLSLYWYLLSNTLWCVLMIALNYSSGSNSFLQLLTGYNIFGLLIGGIALIIASSIVYIVSRFTPYCYELHFAVFFIAHFTLTPVILIIVRLFKLGFKKQQNVS